jgi:hypothetical protein
LGERVEFTFYLLAVEGLREVFEHQFVEQYRFAGRTKFLGETGQIPDQLGVAGKIVGAEIFDKSF